jgi:hypothetical protein
MCDLANIYVYSSTHHQYFVGSAALMQVKINCVNMYTTVQYLSGCTVHAGFSLLFILTGKMTISAGIFDQISSN